VILPLLIGMMVWSFPPPRAENAAVIWLALVENHFPSHPLVRDELRSWHRSKFQSLYSAPPATADSITVYLFSDQPGADGWIVQDSTMVPRYIMLQKNQVEYVFPTFWPDSSISNIRFITRRIP